MNKESDFENCFQLWKTGYGSVRELVEHAEAQRELGKLARRFDFRVFRGTRDWQDLVHDFDIKQFEDALLNKLELPDNVLTTKDLFNWWFFLMRRIHFSTIRRWLALKRDAKRDYKPVEDYDFPVWTNNFENEEIIERFDQCFSELEQLDQWIIRQWWDDKSLREMSRELKSHGVEKSHVTIGKRLNRIFEEFNASLEVPFKQNPPSVMGGRDEHNLWNTRGGGQWNVF